MEGGRRGGISPPKRGLFGVIPTPTLLLVYSAYFFTFAHGAERVFLCPRQAGACVYPSFYLFFIMARSKSGGSRAFLRGRIASDVYSVGKNGKGERQQIVRSRPESVANPRTKPMQVVRMCMKTAALALKNLTPIVNHSWEGVPYGQMSVSEFNKRAFAALMQDYQDHPGSGNDFGFAIPITKEMQAGAYQVAAGSLTIPSSLTLENVLGPVAVLNTGVAVADTLKVKDIKDALGVAEGDYITVLGFVSGAWDGYSLRYQRFYYEPSISEETAVTSANIGNVFRTEGIGGATLRLSSSEANHRVLMGIEEVEDSGGEVEMGALILSANVAGQWLRSNSVIKAIGTPPEWPDAKPGGDAIDEWPIGAVRFLNGGDVA